MKNIFVHKLEIVHTNAATYKILISFLVLSSLSNNFNNISTQSVHYRFLLTLQYWWATTFLFSKMSMCKFEMILWYLLCTTYPKIQLCSSYIEVQPLYWLAYCCRYLRERLDSASVSSLTHEDSRRQQKVPATFLLYSWINSIGIPR